MKVFLNLLKKEWSENAKYFLYYYLGFTIIFIGLVAYVCYDGYMKTQEYKQFVFSFDSILTPMIFSFPVGGVIAIYWGHNSLFKREKMIQTLTLPASNLQKWLCLFTIYSISFFIISLIWNNILMISVEAFINSLEFVKRYRTINNWSNQVIKSNVFIFFLLILLFIQSVFYVGLFHFKKYGIIKTLFISIVIVYLFFEHTSSMAGFFGGYNNPFKGEELGLGIDEDDYFAVYNNSKLIEFLLFIFTLSVPIILFIASYFKLKERELR
ncbi:hypothetical protein CAPN002_19160 [Capnocytophaga stomatis]|uniref:hypothetical protein n=1 Tax=Capnocytophaga stomatis TaxID=1848904 RepID=UPI00194F1CF5|nr:hypothetical protein [Capnocytophaga stomatis]GIJ94698.1 hypothetical protein CAPN002_19160 [Capnocytophaga stomatis]GIM49132.1 hypothetical protein CAPN003_05840 [Capnocytophaga stomatis]